MRSVERTALKKRTQNTVWQSSPAADTSHSGQHSAKRGERKLYRCESRARPRIRAGIPTSNIHDKPCSQFGSGDSCLCKSVPI